MLAEKIPQDAENIADQILNAPEEILAIPRRLEGFQMTLVQQLLVKHISPDQLGAVLSDAPPR